MAATSSVNTLILNSVINLSIDNIDVISLTRASGEFFRKAYQNVTTISATERKYEFYLNETEGSDIITKLSLYGNGATTTLGSGTEMVYQIVNIDKTSNNKSLLIYWNVRVV